MSARTPSSLGTDILARRLRDLTGEERNVQVEFLLHLDEFDRRRAFLNAGYDSLWTYCLRALHLREGPAALRIGAMRALRRFPELESPLRDGRLCMSTLRLLAPLLTPENVADLVARAAYRSKSEVEQIVVSIQPRSAPSDGVRKLPQKPQATSVAPRSMIVATSTAETIRVPGAASTERPSTQAERPVDVAMSPVHALAAQDVGTQCSPVPESPPPLSMAPPAPAAELHRHEMRPVSADEWSLRVTIDAGMKADLEMLKSLLSHTVGGDLVAVLREALRCAVEKHGKRRGAVAPSHKRASASRDEASARAKPSDSNTQHSMNGGNNGVDVLVDGGSPARHDQLAARDGGAFPAARKRTFDPRAIPAAVRREVWLRDEGRCAWTSKDGVRCRSRWKLEFDHIDPAARGGPPTTANLRLTCREHNVLHAEQVLGRTHMAKFRKERSAAREQLLLG